MKIGILTLPLNINYGGILQAYALQTVLKTKGHDVTLIDVKGINISKLPLWWQLLAYGKRAVLKYVLGRKDIIVFKERKQQKELPVISRDIRYFVDHSITPRITPSSLTEISSDTFDIIIVGSDQIWRPKYFPHIADAYLYFTLGWNIKRIAYAPSFGVSQWEYTKEQTIVCGDMLKRFTAVSVREDSGVLLCEKYFDVKAQHVLDPTMLLKVPDYINLMKQRETVESNGDMLTYILDSSEDKEDKDEIINYLSKKMGYRTYSVDHIRHKYPSEPVEKCISPSVEQWLRGFYDAKFVITDSFHACVFSILFHKPFIVFANKKRGIARLDSLLKMYNLTDRIVTSASEARQKEDMFTIDWDEVDTLHAKWKETSMKFLEENLV